MLQAHYQATCIHPLPRDAGPDGSVLSHKCVISSAVQRCLGLPSRALCKPSPSSSFMIRQLQQLCRGVGGVPLPAALKLCHVLPRLMMDLNGLSRWSYPDKEPLNVIPT